MKHLFIIFMLICFVSIQLFSQKGETNPFQKGTDEYKLFMAKQDFYGNDFRSALNKFKEVQKNRPNDANVLFWIGHCYYMMKTYQDAIDILEKAKSLDANAHPELSLVLGKAYHMRGMIDKALAEFTSFRKTIADSPKKIAETDIDVYISQCNVAKQLMASPVNVKLYFPIDINSPYDDKGPVLTNGDKTLIFTSRRPAGDKSRIDTQGDYGYFDDVYESYWSEEKKKWLPADMIRGPINTEGYDAVTSVSYDGNAMFLYRNHPSEARGGEIFVSYKSASGKWKAPEILLKPVNTSYYEDAAVLSPDGNTLYFVSERPGGMGMGDIWMSKKTGDAWSEPVNLGTPVNSPYDENGLWLTPDGKTLFFCSNGPKSMGSYDIFMTTLDENGKWSEPVNVGYPINSVDIESKFVMTADKKTAFISSVRDSGMGERDIIIIDLSNYDVLTGKSNPITSTLYGKVISGDSIRNALSVEIRFLEKESGNQVAVIHSDANGLYSVEIPANKSLVLEIIADGYKKLSEEIILSPGKTHSKDIVLMKSN